MLIKSICKKCIYEHLRQLHIDFGGAYKSWLKAHEKQFDKWFEEEFGKNRKMPCPKEAQRISNESFANGDWSEHKKIIEKEYPPFRRNFNVVYVGKPPECCEYVLEHLVSRGITS